MPVTRKKKTPIKRRKKANKLSIGAPVGSTISIEIAVLPPIKKAKGGSKAMGCTMQPSNYLCTTIDARK